MTCLPCTLHFFTCIFFPTEEVKGAVDLIPKPKSPILLSVPESSKDGCIRCAVVGSGGILNNSKMGKEIDSHDYVFRVNGAVTQGYEEDVGNRTSVYVHTAFSLYASILTLKQYGFHNIPQDEVSIFYNFALEQVSLISQSLHRPRSVPTALGPAPLVTYPHRPSQAGGYPRDCALLPHPSLRGDRSRWLQGPGGRTDRLGERKGDGRMRSDRDERGKRERERKKKIRFPDPLPLGPPPAVDAYGFITEDYHKYSNYYYEKLKKNSVIFFINHDYGLEIKTWKKLHDSGIIRLYQRNNTRKN
uniref:alpha-N-acetylgalactosaminide alpha-2,6-sialyltransferase n=1 Tax=Cyprinus carpio TaxID=7962 RepID=A0A8C1WT98_CYPCA